MANVELIKDLERRLCVDHLLAWMDTEGERLGSLGMSMCDQIEFTPPLLQDRSVQAITPGSLLGEHASIRPVGDRYEIQFLAGLPREKTRFAIAHEIGHTYWFAPGGGAKPLSPLQFSFGRDDTIENLCDRFAYSLLMPRRKIEMWLTDVICDPTVLPLNNIPRIANRFGVSHRIAAYRTIIDIYGYQGAIIGLRRAKGQFDLFEERFDNKWKVAWVVTSHTTSERNLPRMVKVPFASSGRVIPDEMIPSVPENQVVLLDVDSRWREGLSRQPHRDAMRPFARRASNDDIPAQVCLLLNAQVDSVLYDHMYIALPDIAKK